MRVGIGVLDGLKDDGHGEGEPAFGRAEAAAFLPAKPTGGVGKAGFEVLEDVGSADEGIEVGKVVALVEELEQAAVPSGCAHIVEGKVVGGVGDNVVKVEGELVVPTDCGIEAWIHIIVWD